MTDPQIPPGSDIEVEAPDGTVIAFPQSMSQDDISAAMRKMYPPTSVPPGKPQAPPAAIPAPSALGGGSSASMPSAAGQVQYDEAGDAVITETGPRPPMPIKPSRPKAVDDMLVASVQESAAKPRIFSAPEPQQEFEVGSLSLVPDTKWQEVMRTHGADPDARYTPSYIADLKSRGKWDEEQEAKFRQEAVLSQSKLIQTRENQLLAASDIEGKRGFLRDENALKAMAAELGAEKEQLDAALAAKQDLPSYNAAAEAFNQKVQEYDRLSQKLQSRVAPIMAEQEELAAARKYLSNQLLAADERAAQDPDKKDRIAMQAVSNAEWMEAKKLMDEGDYLNPIVIGQNVHIPIANEIRRIGGNILATSLRYAARAGEVNPTVPGHYFGDQMRDAADWASEGLRRLDAETPSELKESLLADDWSLRDGALPKFMKAATYAGFLAAGGSVNAMTAVGMVGSSDDYYREGTDAGMGEKEAEAFATGMSAIEAIIERYNPGPFVTKGARELMAKRAAEAVVGGATFRDVARELASYSAKQSVSEGLEEDVTSIGQNALKVGANLATGSELETGLTVKGLAEDAIMGAALGGVMGSAGSMSQRPLYKDAIQWAVKNPEEFTNFVNTKVPEANRKEVLEKFDKHQRIYRGLPQKMPKEVEATIAAAIAEKQRLKEEQSNATIDETVASAIGDTYESGIKKQDEIIADGLGISLVDIAKKNEADRLRDQYDKAKLKSDVSAEVRDEVLRARQELGVEFDPLDDLPESVVNTFSRVEDNVPVSATDIDEASSWMYNKYKQVIAMREDPNRMLTLDQIDAYAGQLGSDIETLELHKQKLRDESEGITTAEKTEPKRAATPVSGTKAAAAPGPSKVTPKAEGAVTPEVLEPISKPNETTVTEVREDIQPTPTAVPGKTGAASAVVEKPVAEDDDVEITLTEDVREDPAELIKAIKAIKKAPQTEQQTKQAKKELTAVKESMSGLGVQMQIHFDEAPFSAAYKEATGKVPASGGEGFFVAKDGKIHILSTRYRSGLGVHEGTHAAFFSALRGSPQGRAVLGKAAKQALGASPQAKAVLVDFLQGYKGGAIKKADGSIDIDATVADPELAHEVVAEFAAGIYSGKIKLESSVKKFLRDLYNKVMKSLGIELEFDPTTDSDYVAIAKQLASAMGAGRGISVTRNTEQPVVFRKTGTPMEAMKFKDDDGLGVDAPYQNVPMSIRRASEAAKEVESRTKAGATQPSMVINLKKNKKNVVAYSGPATMAAVRENRPGMYLNRALDLSKTHLVRESVRKYSSNWSIEGKLKWADTVYAAAKKTVVSNLLYIHDSVDPAVRDLSKLWYDGANLIAQEMSSKYDITLEQAAALIATQSPQKPWFDNVHLAHFIADFHKNNQSTVFDQSDYDYYVSQGAGYPKQAKYFPILKSRIGTPYSELSLYDKAAMTRSRFDQNYERRAPLRLPNGEMIDERVDSPSSFSGYDTVAKGISVIIDGSADNILGNLGKDSKVPNFYNNISSPQTDGEVTIDTHAIAAGYVLPIGSKAKEVKFDPATYAFMADAYREAAKSRGVLAREMQSITWEGIKSLFPPNKRGRGTKTLEAVRRVWDDYVSGKIEQAEAQERISKYGEDASITDWSGSIATMLDRDEATSYLGELSRNSGGPTSIGSGDGGPGGRRLSAMEVRSGWPSEWKGESEAIDDSFVPFSIGREEDGSLRGLPRKFKVDGKEMEASHWQPAEDVAVSYMEKAGLPYNPPSEYVKVDKERAKRIADAYEAMRHYPDDPEVKRAYDALAKETTDQYKAVMDSGLKVEFIPPGAPDPYAASPRLATEDIRKNNHMWVFGTRDGFGSSEFDPKQNPLLKETEFTISGQPALVNDLFRVVHDYFGHVKEGVGFRADGEENAWRMHSAMFSPEAQRALTTETRGQNSWVNFGPSGEANRKASGADTIYADQKTGLLPEWVSEDGRYDDPGVLMSRKADPKVDLVPKDLRKELTDDGKGNYVFFHKGPAKLKGGKIDPQFFGKGATKDKRVHGNMNYYTKPDHGESTVKGEVNYAVLIPKGKVYPLRTDPLDLYDQAEANFRKKFKNQAFDAPRQADFIMPLAEKAGFDMLIAGWSIYPLRGESTKALKPDAKATEEYTEEPLDLTTPEGYEKWMATLRSTDGSAAKLARAIIGAGNNTKAKARAYLKEVGAEEMIDDVMAEFDRLKEKPVAKMPVSSERPGEMFKHATAKRLKQQHPEIYNLLSKEDIEYERLPNSVSIEAAEQMVGYMGVSKAANAVLNTKNGIPSATRTFMARMVARELENSGDIQGAADFIASFMDILTDMGQGIQAMRDMPEFATKSMILANIKDTIRKQRKKLEKKAAKRIHKLHGEIIAINKEVIDQVARTTVVQTKTLKASAPIEGTEPKKAKPNYGASNRVFTKAKYAQAWKELMGQMPAGIPPQLITIAGYHIEAGARSFAAVAEQVMKRGGNKLLPYLKGAYKEAAKNLGVDPTPDNEIDEEIAKLNTLELVDRLKKAISRGDRKESADLVSQLQAQAKDFDAWGAYQQYASDRIRRMADQEIAEDRVVNDAMRDFTDGLVRNITAQMREEEDAKGVAGKAPQNKKSDIEIIGEAFKNFEKYKAVWAATQNQFKAKLRAAEARLEKADTPQAKEEAEAAVATETRRLEKLDAYFGDLMVKPFSEAGLGRAVKRGMKELGQKIDEIIRQHYTVHDEAKRTLQQKLIAEAGLTEPEASTLAAAVAKEFDRLATERKRKVIDGFINKKERKKRDPKGIEDDIVTLTNAGALSDSEFIEAYGKAMGWPELSAENVAEIERLADKVQRVPEGRPRLEATEDLLKYQENLKGVDPWEVARGVWYANTLSGFQTQEVNAIANAIQIMTELGVASARAIKGRSPSDMKDLARALAVGFKRGATEAKSSFNTGYSPIRGKVEVPAILERFDFKKIMAGDIDWNPANYLKFVRRTMVAADVLFFEAAKEMRAQQFAMKMARSSDPSQDIRQKAMDLMGRNDQNLQEARNQAQEEYQAEVDAIESSGLKDRALDKAMAKAEFDRKRRVFELVEQGRDEAVREEAARFAARATYNFAPTGVLGSAASGLNSFINDVPGVRYMVPFVNIIANVSNETLNYTPVGYLRSLRDGQLTNFNREELTDQQLEEVKSDLNTKATIGMLFMVSMFMLSGGDDEDPLIEITANGHGNYKQNKQLRESRGWQPYSIKVRGTDKWISYQYTPLMMAMALIGHYRDAGKYRKEKIDDNYMTKWAMAAQRSAASFFDSSMLGSVRELMESIYDERGEDLQETIAKTMAKIGKAFVVPALYTQAARGIESMNEAPMKNVQGDAWGYVIQDIPVLRDSLKDQLNWLGEPLPPEGGWFPRFVEDAKHSPIADLISEKRYTPSVPSSSSLEAYDPSIDKKRVFTKDEQYEFFKIRGRIIKKTVEKKMGKLKAMDREEFDAAMTKLMGAATTKAKAKVIKLDLPDE